MCCLRGVVGGVVIRGVRGCCVVGIGVDVDGDVGGGVVVCYVYIVGVGVRISGVGVVISYDGDGVVTSWCGGCVDGDDAVLCGIDVGVVYGVSNVVITGVADDDGVGGVLCCV